jgi:signal recognition particle receptor subunit alpha
LKGGASSNGASPTASPRKTGVAAKLMRKWDNSPVTAADMAALDYSAPAPQDAKVSTEGLVSNDAMGQRKGGMYEVAEWDYRPGQGTDELPSEEEILARGTSRLSIKDESDCEEASKWTGLFSRLTGSKVLTKQDLAPVLAEMERNLMDKNVAKDIAEKLCESVGAALVGQKLAGLTSESVSDND